MMRLSHILLRFSEKKKTTGQITIRYIITTTLISGADPGFLDRGFKLAEGGGVRFVQFDQFFLKFPMKMK